MANKGSSGPSQLLGVAPCVKVSESLIALYTYYTLLYLLSFARIQAFVMCTSVGPALTGVKQAANYILRFLSTAPGVPHILTEDTWYLF